MNDSRPVVSNAGPLMVLSKLNALSLLPRLYGYVHIPQSVYSEVVEKGIREGFEDALRLQLFLDQLEWMPQKVAEEAIPATLAESALARESVMLLPSHSS